MKDPELAKAAYEGYCAAASGSKSMSSGEPLFEDLSPAIQLAWDAAADAIFLKLDQRGFVFD